MGYSTTSKLKNFGWRKEVILSSQICLDYKGQEEGKEAEKGIQYTFLFLFPMHPQMQKSQIGLPDCIVGKSVFASGSLFFEAEFS